MTRREALRLLEAARQLLAELDSGRISGDTITELRRAIAIADARANNPRIGD